MRGSYIDIIQTLFSSHTITQKLNYIAYSFSPRSETLAYAPVAISIVATGRCTLACDMCPTHSKVIPRDYPYIQKNEKEMDFEMFKDIIDRFSKALTVQIIGSGEPILNKEFFRMVEYASLKRMTVKTFSNGTTIEENIGNILDSKLDGITISLNGHDSKEFKRMTGMDEAVYDKIYRGTELLIKERDRRHAKVSIKLSFIIDRYNYRFIPAMVDTSLRLGADHTFFCNFLPTPYGGLRAEERVLMADGRTIDDLRNIFKTYMPSVLKKLTPPTLVDTESDKNNCETYYSQMRFDGDGNVSSCSMMLLDMTGNGNYADKDVWNNAFFREMRRAFKSGKKALLKDPCMVCPDNRGVSIR